MKRWTQFVFLTVLFAILVVFPYISIIQHYFYPKTVDGNENRYLAAAPDLTWESLTTTFFADLETYAKDHFFERSGWMRANTHFELDVLQKRIVAGVIPTSKAVIPYIPFTPERTAEHQQALAAQRAEDYGVVMDTLAEWGGVFLFVGLPTQVIAQSELYPEGLYNAAKQQNANMDALFAALTDRNVPYLDLREVYLDKGGYEPYYLKTDHHQTLDGALENYDAIYKALRELGVGVETVEMERRALPNPVLGSRARLLYGASPLADLLEIAAPKKEIPFQYRDTNGTSPTRELCVLPQSPEASIPYTVYVGGDVPESVLETNRPELPDALIYGDSYTNIVETMFYTGFDETRGLDLRHYKGSLLEYIRTHKPDTVVLLRDSSVMLSEEGNGRIGAAGDS